MINAHGTIWKLVRSLDRSAAGNGVTALDAAIRACSGYRSTRELVDEFVQKCTAMKGASRSEVYYFLKRECGIDLNSADTGAITGSDAGVGKVKTAESVVYEPSYAAGTNFEVNAPGKTYRIRVSDGYNIIAKAPALVRGTQQERDVINGLTDFWIAQAAKLVQESYGLYFNKRQDATDYRTPGIEFYLYYDKDDTAAAKTWSPRSSRPYVRVGINMSKYTDFTLERNGNVSGYNGNSTHYLDRVIAHELVHAMFLLNVKPAINATLPQFFREGIAELVHGADDRGEAIYDLVSGKNDLAAALDIKDKGTLKSDCYAAGYMLLRYLAQQVSRGIKPPAIAGLVHSEGNSRLTVTGAFAGNTIDSYRYEVQTIDARKAKRAVTIEGNARDNTIYASAKGGTLKGDYGDDTLYGGAGVDTFFTFGVWGNDTVWNYQSGRDVISLGAASYGDLASATVNGTDVVLKVGTGSFTIKDGAGKYIKINDGYGNISYSRFVSGTATYNSGTARFTSDSGSEAYTLYQKSLPELAYNGARTALMARKSFNGTAIDANQFWWTLKSVNVAAAGQGVTVYGNANVTSMVGSNYDDALYAKGRSAVLKGGKGKDTLQGGTVSSKLYGGADDDLIYGISGTAYLYGEAGNDRILGGQGRNYLYGGLGDDTLVGGEGINVLSGDNGNDSLAGGSGTNTLSGGNGNDSLIGGKGKNTLSGGNGDDYLEGGKGEGTVNKLSGGNGKDRLLGGEGENILHGGNGDDELRGGSGTNLLYGEAGNDELYGGSGNNSLYGGAGNDILTGGTDTSGTYFLKGEAGNDTLTGGAGENTLWGGAGKDILTGGTGKNTFYFASLGELHGDTITNLREADTLYFHQLKGALDLDAICQNYNLGRTTGKNTIALTDDKLTITDKNKRKYTMTLTGGYTGSITLENRSGQRQSFTL